MQNRKRYQEGSLQVRSHGKRRMWVLLYREGGIRKYQTLGLFSKMSKSQAQEKQTEFMTAMNAKQASAPDASITFGEFLEGVALPFLRARWKKSTAGTTEYRIRHHLLKEFGKERFAALTLKRLQALLSAKAATHSRSVVAHLRWDMRAIFKIALAEGYIQRDPTGALFTPRDAKVAEKRVMNRKEAEQFIAVMDIRERVIAHLAILVGMRPGEILALQRRHVSADGGEVIIEQRLYRGDIDAPKTESSKRIVALPSHTAAELRQWMELVGAEPTAWVFASENPAKPLWRDNVWIRSMKPRLKAVGLEWASFQVMRRTHASLGHEAGVDPKVSADQRGHGIGVALDVYTKSSIEARRGAAERLEVSILNQKAEAESVGSGAAEAVVSGKKRSQGA